jgi:hypothetical protein
MITINPPKNNDNDIFSPKMKYAVITPDIGIILTLGATLLAP